jgi:hypothetical protein
MRNSLHVIVFCYLIIVVLSPSAFTQVPDIDVQLKSVPSVSYPPEALITGLEGVVSVYVDIDEKGSVTSVREAMGPDWTCANVSRMDVVAMRKLATKAAEKAIFTPAVREGKPFAWHVLLKFDFKSPSPKKAPEITPARVVESDTGSTQKLVDSSTTGTPALFRVVF